MSARVAARRSTTGGRAAREVRTSAGRRSRGPACSTPPAPRRGRSSRSWSTTTRTPPRAALRPAASRARRRSGDRGERPGRSAGLIRADQGQRPLGGLPQWPDLPSRPVKLMARIAFLAAICALVIAGPIAPADAKPKVKLKLIGRFKKPVYVSSAPGVRGIFVVEQGGRIRLQQGKKRRTFLKIGGLVRSGGEQGLLSVAFAPDYAASRFLYVYFNDNNGDIEIAELRADPNGLRAARSTLRPIIVIPHPRNSNHNGGQLQFGPDGRLYAGTGDGGGSGDAPDNAQNPNSNLGKLLQIDTTAPGNPIRMYARGLRNPYRFSFDLISEPGQPRIAIADVGQDRFEEIDYLGFGTADGANFGWNDFEGFAPFPGAHPPTASPTVKPIKVYPLKGRTCAVVGGYVVRDSRLRSLRGRYVYGDFCAGWVRSLIPRLGGARRDRDAGVRVPSLSSFGETADGSLYATSLRGAVYRFVRKS